MRLKASGVSSASYYSTPLGYAILTPLERIAGGVPIDGPERWLRQKDVARWNLADYARKLFAGDGGQYRMVLISIGEGPTSVASYKPTNDDVERWAMTGATGLDPQLRARPLSPDTRISIFVYEFALEKGRLKALQSAAPTAAISAHTRSLGLTR